FSQVTATPQGAPTKKGTQYTQAFKERTGGYPVYAGYYMHDAMNMYANAVKTTGTTDDDKIVTSLEAMQYDGTVGTIDLRGPDEEFTHDPKYGQDFVQYMYFQWQQGNQVVFYPDGAATGSYEKASWM
ncbi:MAG: ABC transporter substrate-binding protein, partial [Halanaeroarchaeum sp.]